MKLTEYLTRVEDQKSFLVFARAMLADQREWNQTERMSESSPYGLGREEWVNASVDGFLESAIAWAEDSDFGNNIEPIDNPWKQFALFLYGGKIYE